jgi:hypothetical protein
MNPPRLTKLALTWKRDIQSEPTRELNNQKNHMFWAISQPLAFVCYTNDLFFVKPITILMWTSTIYITGMQVCKPLKDIIPCP